MTGYPFDQVRLLATALVTADPYAWPLLWGFALGGLVLLALAIVSPPPPPAYP